MRQVRYWFLAVALAALAVPTALAAPAQRGNVAAVQGAAEQEYVIVIANGASLADVNAAVAALGGTIVEAPDAVGVATIRTSNPNFLAQAASQKALFGAARNRPVAANDPRKWQKREGLDEELNKAAAAALAARKQTAGTMGHGHGKPSITADPLAPLMWDMDMLGANTEGSYRKQKGSKGVLAGVIDTGIDGSHPDIAPNFSKALSRNFVTDMPDIDGPCEYPSCVDPVDVDDNGHGTHVAGTIGAALNGIGMSGVAPNVTLVNIRAGQDSGYFFLQPTVDALIYAGQSGVDVVNMSFYVDPWYMNCISNPADSPEAQMEQRTIIEATQRAANYARRNGVTLVAAEGNNHEDLGHPRTDFSSPDYPIGAAYPREIDNKTCFDIPAETKGVITVSSIGPSKAKADYSNYGVEQTDVSAPGGYYRDRVGTPDYATVNNLILSAYPRALGDVEGTIDPTTGDPLTPFVVRDCQKGVCAYYQYLQGTSMAAPHVVGVVALIVSEYGHRDRQHGGLTLDPKEVEKILYRTATETPCPNPRLVDYSSVNRPAEFNAYCQGSKEFNGFYGHGIVNAADAVGARGWR